MITNKATAVLRQIYGFIILLFLPVLPYSCRTPESTSKGSATATELFTSLPQKVPYRIPAITQTKRGRIIAVADYRYCGSDIGFGRIDLHTRLSDDNGKTWKKERVIAKGSGIKGNSDCGFGDATLVADDKSNTVLLLCVRGNTVYTAPTTTRKNPNRVARMYSYDGGETWTKPEEITEEIYSLFDGCSKGTVESLFVGSGKMLQSRQLKAGTAKRIYAALCARPNGNRVIYSDDFGKTWNILGTAEDFPAPQGDEPKCAELPNGDILLSSRAGNGRIFNIFSYTKGNKQTGTWSKAAYSSAKNNGINAEGNSCNGGVLIVPVKRNTDGKKAHLLLQSVPFGKGRTNVGIYYKPLISENDYATPEAIAANWEGRLQCSNIGSAYSELILQKNNTIGFIFEESTHQADYTIVYKQLTIEQITGGRYTLRK